MALFDVRGSILEQYFAVRFGNEYHDQREQQPGPDDHNVETPTPIVVSHVQSYGSTTYQVVKDDMSPPIGGPRTGPRKVDAAYMTIGN